jgi:hypothetical protein
MLSDFRGPEEKPACLQSQGAHSSYALAGIKEKGYPAGACGAIGLSFRALARIVFKFRSTNLEMIVI